VANASVFPPADAGEDGNRLSAISAIINDQAVAVLLKTRFLATETGGIEQVTHQFLIRCCQVLYTGQMFLRYQQQMYRSLRLDVMKNQQMFILMDNPGRAFAGYDPAENTVLHSVIKTFVVLVSHLFRIVYP